MRKHLAKINNCRSKFTAIFVRYGKKPGFKGYPVTTLCFRTVRNINGTVLTDHIWFTTCKGFEQYDFEEGDKVSFDARVKVYYKGCKGYREDEDLPPVSKDYKLSHPNNIIKLTGTKKKVETKQLNLAL